jgi:hypothetical protein
MTRSPMSTVLLALAICCTEVYGFMGASSFARANAAPSAVRQGDVTMRLFNPFGTNYNKVRKADIHSAIMCVRSCTIKLIETLLDI